MTGAASRRRNVVLVLSTLFKMRGGIPRYNQLLCRAIDELAPELGLRGSVLSQDDDDDGYEEARAAWTHLRFVAGGGPRGVSVRALSLCARQWPDLMLIGYVGMTPVGLACRPFLRHGYGFVAHGFETWDVRKPSRRFCARRARRVLSVSRWTADRLVESARLDTGRVHVLPAPLDPAFLDDADQTVHDPSPPEVLTVSRLDATEDAKGIDTTIRAIPPLLAEHPGLTYRIVGAGTDRARLQELARSLGLADRVVFEQDLGDAELAGRYRCCSIFVLPSGQEGFGIVFLEAMAFGKPCIGGRFGGTPEVIEDGQTGLLVPFGDAAALTAAIRRLLGDRELRRTMGRRGRQRLKRRFRYEHYREALGRHLEAWLAGA